MGSSSTWSGPSVWLAVLPFGVLVAAALYAVERRRPRLLAWVKPGATVALVPVLGWPPVGDLGVLLAAGFLLAAAGDWALLKDDRGRFLMGVVFFLGAHLLFIAAFAPFSAAAAGARVGMAVPAAAFFIAAAVLVAGLWPTLGSMRLPVVVYGAVIAAMAAIVTSTLRGLLRPEAAGLAAVGATLFFASDALLAWRRFRRPFAHAQTLTLVLYWGGELAMALGARLA